ncbi:MAG: dihydrolipoyl dehydrogenase [Acidimicrobiales bacterium]
MVRTADRFDVVVIGGGPGGYAAALYGAAAGLSVAVVERDKVGGTCLHRGCVPAKEFLETAAVFRTVGAAKEFGVQADAPTVDFSVSQARKQKVVDQLWKGLSGLMKRRKITVVEGTATLAPGRAVRVDTGAELVGDHVVLAAGSVPRTLPGFEVDGRLVVTSDEFLALDRLPAAAAVIGGGAIGCEFASTLADLGTEVTVLEALPSILAGCDQDVVAVVAKAFARRGIKVHTGVVVQGHAPGDAGTTVQFGDGQSVTVDQVVVAVGRRPRSEGLLAPGTGVELDGRGYVPVDQALRTAAEGVFAVGDLISVPGRAHPQLAHVGFAEGINVIKNILGEAYIPVDYARVPWCIYSHPEVAFAGLTEDAARDAGYDVVVSKHSFGGNARAMIVGDVTGLVKVVAERGADGRAGTILGVHLAGPWVTEQLGQGYLAVNWEATVDEVAQFIQPHPTLSETFGETVLSLTGRGLHG